MARSQTLHGFHAVLARLRVRPGSVREIFIDATRRDARARDLISLAEARGARVLPVTSERIDRLVPGARHQGVVALVEAIEPARDLAALLDALEGTPLLLVLDGVTDPHNLGACLRVADGAGVHAVIAPKDRAAGINDTVARVSAGAVESVPYITVTNLVRTLRELKERGIWLIGTDDRTAASLYQADLKGPLAWVMGAEGEGMRRLTREACDTLVGIPMAGAVESLNVSVAAGICLYESVRQRAA